MQHPRPAAERDRFTARVGVPVLGAAVLALAGALSRSRAQRAELIESSTRLRAELEWRGMRDSLTDLPNRAFFDHRLDQATERARRTGAEMAVLFIDLDGFKAINDTSGHLAGDLVLAEVGRRLANSVRASETVARYGGDEFTLLCEDVASPDEPIAAARRISAALEKPYEVAGRTVRMDCSIGIAISEPGVASSSEIVRAADLAMYRAKAQRRPFELATGHEAAASAGNGVPSQ